MIAVIRLGQTLDLNRGRKRMLDASNPAQIYICVAQTRIWVKVVRKEMEGWRERKMVMDAMAKIADRDTPTWPLLRSPGVGQEANLANCLRKTPPHISVLFFSLALLSSLQIFRVVVVPSPRIVGLSRFSNDMADASGNFVDDWS